MGGIVMRLKKLLERLDYKVIQGSDDIAVSYTHLISFPVVMLLTVAAGLTGSWALYLLGRFGGGKVLGFYFRKFPKHRPVIEEKMEFLRKKGSVGVFVSKLLPMVRTIISIPAGMVKMDFAKYTISSVCGIFLWNLAFVGAGYFFGDAAVRFLF